MLLFAHGSGAGHDHPWMQAWAARLGRLAPVRPLTYAYRAAGKRFPSRLPALVDEHLAAARAAQDAGPLVLVGKSLGSRVGCVVAAELAASGHPPAGVVCLGYPLRSQAKTPTLRDAPLRALPVPALFVQGTRDPLAPLPLLESTLGETAQDHDVHVVLDGDHSLLCRKRPLKAAGLTQEDRDAAALAAVEGYLQRRGVLP